MRAVQFSPDGRRLLSASEDGTARLWDPETGHPVSEPMRHGARVTDAEFSPDGSQVVTFSSDKAVRTGRSLKRRCQHPIGCRRLLKRSPVSISMRKTWLKCCRWKSFTGLGRRKREHGFGLLRPVGAMVLCGQRGAHDIALFGRHHARVCEAPHRREHP